MGKITCELCGNSDFLKENDFFVCQCCGMKYPLSEARKLLGVSAPVSEQTVSIGSERKVSVDVDQLENYLLLVRTALKSSNFTEAESYCNKIIEIQPQNSTAWFLKGTSAGLLSGIQCVRIQEAIACYENAIQFAEDSNKDAVKSEALVEIRQISDTHMEVLCNSFYNNPCGFHDSIMWFMDLFQNVVSPFISSCGGDAQGFMLDISLRMFNTAVSAYNNSSFHRFDEEYWGEYSRESDKCINLLYRYVEIDGVLDEQKIAAYENIQFISEELLSTYPVVNVILEVDPIQAHYNQLINDCQCKIAELSGVAEQYDVSRVVYTECSDNTAQPDEVISPSNEMPDGPVLSENDEVGVLSPEVKPRRMWWAVALLAILVVGGGIVMLMTRGSNDLEYFDMSYCDSTVVESVTYTDEEEVQSPVDYSDGVLHVYDVDYPMSYITGGELSFEEDVVVESFLMGQYEVTQYIWEAIMGTDVYQQRDKTNPKWSLRGVGDNYPMYYVNYYEALEFCNKLNKLTGLNFYIPSELQWEYAARGGCNDDCYRYSGSDDIDFVAWYKDNSNELTHEVGKKYPNSLGLYDMSGNVREWCSDGSAPILRGGGWFNDADAASVSSRYYDKPEVRDNNYGFRLCL